MVVCASASASACELNNEAENAIRRSEPNEHKRASIFSLAKAAAAAAACGHKLQQQLVATTAHIIDKRKEETSITSGAHRQAKFIDLSCIYRQRNNVLCVCACACG